MRLHTKYDEIFSQKLETKTGKTHRFLGFALSRKDAESINIEVHDDILPGKNFDPIHIRSGTILYIPSIPCDDDLFGVSSSYQNWEFTIKPISNLSFGDKYHISYSGSKKGVYRGITKKDKVMDVPPMSPLSDYYLGQKLERSEEFLINII